MLKLPVCHAVAHHLGYPIDKKNISYYGRFKTHSSQVLVSNGSVHLAITNFKSLPPWDPKQQK